MPMRTQMWSLVWSRKQTMAGPTGIRSLNKCAKRIRRKFVYNTFWHDSIPFINQFWTLQLVVNSSGITSKTYSLVCTLHWLNYYIFWSLINVHRSVVGTFLCGPAVLATVLSKKCVKYTDVDPRKTKFYFNKENFWAKQCLICSSWRKSWIFGLPKCWQHRCF